MPGNKSLKTSWVVKSKSKARFCKAIQSTSRCRRSFTTRGSNSVEGTGWRSKLLIATLKNYTKWTPTSKRCYPSPKKSSQTTYKKNGYKGLKYSKYTVEGKIVRRSKEKWSKNERIVNFEIFINLFVLKVIVNRLSYCLYLIQLNMF